MRSKSIPVCALLIAGAFSTGFDVRRFITLGTGATQASSRVVKITSKEATEHQLNTDDPIRMQRGERRTQFLITIDLEVVVDESGNVLIAKAISGPQEFYTRAIELSHKWRFQPFTRKGKPVCAKFVHYVYVLPPELLPLTHVPFPDVRNLSKLRITLQRSSCHGVCPDYSVEIHGDGSVIYSGNRYVAIMGVQRDLISEDALRQLLDFFRVADYYSLRDEYSFPAIGPATCTTSISIDGQTKTVVDDVGILVGMPRAVTDLENAIDRIAATAKWVGVDPTRTRSVTRTGR